MKEKVIWISIYEDNQDFLESLSALISVNAGMALAGTYNNCDQVEDNLRQLLPDVVLMDIDMPGTNGMEGLKRIKNSFPSVEVMMLTVFDDNEHIFECICHGASGYLLKKTPPAKIIGAIRDVMEGEVPMSAGIARKVLQFFPVLQRHQPHSGHTLSDREKEVLSHLVKGLSYKMIAAELNISIDTVRAHIKKIYEKLQVHTMTEAVVKAIHNRII